MITSTNGSAVDARSGIGGKQMNNDNGGEALAGDSAAAGMAGSVEYGQNARAETRPPASLRMPLH